MAYHMVPHTDLTFSPAGGESGIRAPQDLVLDDIFVDLSPAFGRTLALKCEGFNFAGSVKAKAAAGMLAAAEQQGRIRPGSTIIESSSGSLGVAVAAIAANLGYRFVCVTDVRCSPRNASLMRVFGAEVVVVSEPDPVGGLLGARIRYVQERCTAEPAMFWLNQYANDNNWLAHYGSTGPAIVKSYPDLEYLFVGAGTTGTLTGCARYLKEAGHPAKVVAVDSVGSVTFGGPAGPRYIPGLGTGRRPEIADESVVDEILMVEEVDAIRMCRFLARRGFLFGGSTGTVLAGAFQRLLGERPDVCAVAISPDFGERYLDSVYDDDWVGERFGEIGLFAPVGESAGAVVEISQR
ncbi:2,3-diaminopropionate biosynthesis protein SbnA [Kitasatospora sp. MBT63]|uniref:2,3-diaminopropionate biosynthesis protein SbnA n=1 Tax=Kitasatospora sp. MBT63 TaxID=1444768 RepID=UPI000A61E977|nr:2,3-diaminopropionate biosynthesis protein SbnA [Kitasatospora sp. MBT63]